MTDKNNTDLAAAMSSLLEQELLAGAGLEPAAAPPAAAVRESVSLSDRLEADVRRLTAEALRLPEEQLDPEENLANFGIDSIAITEVMVKISRAFSIQVAPTTFFEARNLRHLADILRQRHGAAIDARYTKEIVAPPPVNVAAGDSDDLAPWLSRHRAHRRQPVTAQSRPAPNDAEIPVAIIAMDGRFPQSPDLESLETHLEAGDDCVTEVPADRWDWRKVWGDPRQGPFTRIKWGGFVPDVDLFDASLFTISPHEAELMDPQHRLFMECVWALIDRAGIPHAALDGRKIGLFLGINLLDYVNLANQAGITDAQRMTGLGHAFCPNRLSFLLNVHGPSEVVDTACSSSAVALHRAVMSIRHEGCDMAIAGGSNLMLSPDQHVLFSQVGMLSPQGRCHTFSAQADGYTRADGVGAVLLKRLDLAERDGDPILGVIRASVAHHGGTTSSLTAPNPASQARLIVEAHTRAGTDPRSITMVECHGTGTKLGDPVEIEGLKAAFAQLYAERGLPAPTTPHCGIGSIKSNIGHAETAAGIAGLIKLLLAINSGTQYRSLHASPVNPMIDLDGSPFAILHESRPWQRPIIDGIEAPRRAGLSSFGAGGANVHVVVEEHRAAPAQVSTAPRPLVVPVSARSRDGLRRLVAALRQRVNEADVESLAWTLQSGRTHWPVRMAFVAADAAQLVERMDAFLADDSAARQVERRHSAVPITATAPTVIAAGWMAGDSMDWLRLWGATPPRRLALPPTPFERKRYWLPIVQQSPITHSMALHAEGGDRFKLELKGDEFFLADHRLNDTPVLPGVAYLELARAAAHAAGLPTASLKGVVWVRPMMVDAPITVEISLDRSSGMVEIASRKAGAELQRHAQLRLDKTATSAGPAADLTALRRTHPQAYSGEQIYAAFESMGLNYGPAHRAITALWTGVGPQVLAQLTLPPVVAETLPAYPLHPSLLDGAFQAAIGMALAEGGTPAAALPFAIDAIDILGPLEAEMWVHIRPAAKAETAQRVRTLDLDLLAADGSLRMRLTGFATRLQAATVLTDAPPTHTWMPHWRAAVPTTNTWGHRHIIRAETSGDLAQRYTHLAQQVLAAAQSATPSTLVQVVIEDGPDAEALAGVIGLLRSASQERPHLAGQVLILPADSADPETRLAQAAALPPGTKLRWENHSWWQEDWQQHSLPPAAAPWRDGQVVLITGGLGGLGRLLADAIHKAAPAARLVLTGRSSADDSARDWLGSIDAEYVAADITDALATQALVDGIRSRHGHLDGIVHAAGILDDGFLATKNAAGLAAVLAPKVDGAVNLDRAIGGGALDFFVLFASIAAVMGSAGQTDYAAANGFLEGFAVGREVRRRAGLVQGRTIAIAWPLWAEGGMRIDAQAEAMMTRTTGLVSLPSAAGMDVLARALAVDGPRLLVSAGDAEKLARRLAGTLPVAAPAPVTTQSHPDLFDKLRHGLMTAAARQLKVAVDDLADDEELTEYGFDSISFTQFANTLNDLFDLELTPTLFFEHPTLAGLARTLADRHGSALAAKLGLEPTAPVQIHSEVPAPVAVPPAPPVMPAPSITDDPVAIIAMAGQFPGADNVETFWANLDQGRDCIREIPADRWDWRAIWGDPKTEPGKCNVRSGGFMDGIDQFDAGFFGLSAPEARTMDPQQRLLLTQAWRLFENAGIPPKALSGSDTGVFIGIADTGYGRLASTAGNAVEGYAMTGLAPSLGPNRISFHFNLHGPSVAVETACSSALVAVHRAVEAIRGGSCEAAIAGGVNLLLVPDTFIGFSRAGMLAPDGHSKPFSAAADGYGRGEGIGLVLLKRLSAAQRDGDRILALIRASGENHGGRASSLTAPNPKAQADLLRNVYGRAGFDPRSVSYIEAHGTGTPLGDPIEIEALTHAFADLSRQAETRFGPAPAMNCVLGSVKSNIGHLELAAGIAGLIKVVSQMQAGTIAASLQCETLNPYLKLAGTPFRVAQNRQDWPRVVDAQGRALPRRAGVSSFGFGGANAHVVVEEYLPPSSPIPATVTGPCLLVLSAHSPEALTAQAGALRAFIAQGHHDLSAIAFSLQTTREAMEHRLACSAASPAEALLRLDAFLAGHDDPALHQGRVKSGRGAVSVLESDPDIAQAIIGLAAKGRADGLLEVWVKGFAVDWRRLHGVQPPPRVALPPYPLANTRHWIKTTSTAAAMPAVAPLPTVPTPVVTAPVEHVAPAESALAALTAIAARVLEVAPEVLDPDTELGEFGFDSITMTGFAAQVNAELQLSLTPADFFEFATLNRLAAHIAGSATLPVTAKTAPSPAPVMAPAAVAGGDIAIVGFSCRFPQASDGDAFWDNLLNGRDCITRIPADRWDWQAIDGDPKTEHGKTNIHWGGFIDGVFEFDPLFFGISPREAKLMDPQQRLIMMHVWKAIEDSGHAPRSLAGRRVGLFVGTSSSGYRDSIGDATGGEGYVATGAVPSVGPNRISYFLDWHGPSEPVETACSSSLVALHRAVQAMRAGDCDMAVVGGVNTIVTPEAHINFAKAGMLSPDGRCKTFAADANGYVRGEGVGMLVLKFVADAEADCDPILAVVRSSAVNHGGRANSLTAPNTAAQTALVQEAQRRAGIDPATIGYVEAHGTGTKLGDPVEINALKAAFAGAHGARVGIGSVKTNIGHLELAAGAAGMIKVLLQMAHRTLVPSLHCDRINPYVQLDGSPFHIVRDAEDWPQTHDADGTPLPRRAGISSFGFGGVNAHVILEEYRRPTPPPAAHAGPLVVVLSAQNAERLADQARALRDFVAGGRVAAADLPDLAFTLQVGRDSMRHRLALVVTTQEQLRDGLDRFLAGDNAGLFTGKLDSTHKAGPAIPADQPADILAGLWVTGADIDWACAYPQKRRRLRLPTYAFARDVYRISNDGTALAKPRTFSRVLHADDVWLADHRVRGARILPGAMGLELARAACTPGTAFTPLSLSRVVWQQPLRLDSGSTVVSVPLDAQSFRMVSGDGIVHMLGMAEAMEDDRPRLAVDQIAARCPDVMTADRLYAAYAELGLQYGPAFQPVQQVLMGDGEALARLRLPATADRPDLGLNPSMVDGAFQTALGLFQDGNGDGGVALPFGIDRAEILAPTTAEMWAHVRHVSDIGGTIKLDVELTDADGTLCLRISGFTLRRLKAGKPAPDLRAATIARLAELVAREAAIPVAEVEADAALEAYGIDSIMITRLTDALERDFGPLPKTLFFDCRTLAALADWFAAHHGPTLSRLLGDETAPPPMAPAVETHRVNAAPLSSADEPIAIIGLAGRFPEAADLGQFWRNLEQGRDCIREIPPDRWDHSRFFDPRPGQPGKTYGKWGGFLDGIDCFDPLFFNISPREAEYLDPQERLFLQCAWQAIEDAGLTRASLASAAPGLDGADVGVFVGVMYEEYQLYGAERSAAGQPLALSSSAASIANRVSSFCGFHGPSLAVDTMCSSSLTAIHLASESLRAGSCRVALAGGVNLSVHPNKYLGLGQGRFLSSSGRCESFGRGGDGYVPSEGVGAVLLKPLRQAEADGDRILGVIRATALNHGGHTNGYTVPNPAAQSAVITKALDKAKVSPRQISYVEAHGTGTALGDPIEIAALSRAFAQYTQDRGFCAIGSVKSNIGHCESAAGMAGLAKVLLQFRHRKLAPSLHSQTLNPGIDFAATPFVVQQHLADWPSPDGQPRLAGLSSFGAGGANAHLILQEYVAPPALPLPQRRDVFPLSARTPDRLDDMVLRLRDALRDLDESDLPSVAHTLQTGREAFEERLALVAATKAELLAALDGPFRHRQKAGRNQGSTATTTDADTIAAAWVRGANVDWRAWRGTTLPARIALPGYPFAQERYWVPGAPVLAASKIALPLLFAPHWQADDGQPAPRPAHRLVVLVEPPATAPQSVAETIVLPPAAYADHATRLLALLQDLFKRRPDSALVQVVVDKTSPLSLDGLGGLLRSATQERPSIRCQMVRLDMASANLAQRLDRDAATTDADIRYQDGQRLVRRWHEIIAPIAPSPWRDDGIYLITGGAGGVGRHVCEHILDRAPQAVIWLCGRSPQASEPDSRIRYRAADVTDPQAVDNLVAEILATHGRLNGVIHAAGQTRDSLLVRKSETDLRAVLAPKVAGTLALDRATARCGLDFMVLFASVSGALGNVGQADYAAANAWLDGFAAQRPGRTVAIDWPYWQDGGMRLGDDVVAAMERNFGARPLDTQAAMAALDAVLMLEGESQVLVLAGDAPRLRQMINPVQVAAPPKPAAIADTAMASRIAACVSQVLKVPVERLTADAPWDQFGMDSVAALEIVAALEAEWGPLPPTLLFENPTIGHLAATLAPHSRPSAPQAAPLAESKPSSDDIAIIAVAGRYPGANSPEDLWELLQAGGDGITEVPADRWDPAYSPAKGKPGASHCKWGGFIDDVASFDAGFFGYSPRAADLADPHERLFLETTWHLLERAGHTRNRLRQDYQGRVGVFVGAMYQHYAALADNAETRALLLLNSYSAMANRVSFFFDLQGPSVAVDCMCSSGLEAVHQACLSLKAGDCRLAIAGAVNLSLLAAKYQGLSRAGLVGSHDGSRSFAQGDGYLPAEGVGAVLLKPLAQAVADGDRVLAVIKAVGANHAGHSAGFGVPSADAQAQLMADTIGRAGIDPATIGYVEAAANGAALGDAIELRALGKVFSELGLSPASVPLGAVKANLGHAEAASGLAQLTKVLLQLQHRSLAPTLRPRIPNTALDFAHSPFRPQWDAAPWAAPLISGRPQPRRAVLSAFGAGGSNVTMVVEEAPAQPVAAETCRRRSFPVSARTPEQLSDMLAALAGFVAATPDLSLAALSRTLRRGRETMACRVTVCATDQAELLAKLKSVSVGSPEEERPDQSDEDHGPMLVLPPYPFARERHWLPLALAPATASQSLLPLILEVLAGELGQQAAEIDPHAPFSGLGIDSMAVLRLGYAVEEATGIRLDRRDLDEAATPARLAATLESRTVNKPPAVPKPSPANGPWRCPLSEGQKGLWVIHSLYPESGNYNVPLAFRLDGIDHRALERACHWLGESFPILTARVVDNGDEPMLVAGPPANLQRIELPKGMDPLDFARRRAAQPFALTEDAPIRFDILGGGALGGDHQILLVTVHHLVFDGASAAVLTHALWHAYGCFAAGSDGPDRPQAADYIDFVAWERDLLASERGQGQLRYWQQQLSGELPVTTLPADRPALPGTAIDGRSLESRLNASLTLAARRTARDLGVSLAALFLAVTALLTYRHTGQSDHVIGIPTLRRPQRRFAQSLGFFVNMLALRLSVRGEGSAADLAAEVQRQLSNGQDHADLPFATLARSLGGNLNGEPPYQISFAYQNFPMGQATDLPEGTGSADFIAELRQPGDSPFGLELYEEGDSIRVVAGYDGARFDAASIARLLDRFARLTAALCADPRQPAGRLDMLAPDETKRLRRWRSRPAKTSRPAVHVADWIATQAKATPDAIAVIAGEDSLTYRRLTRQANRLARHLRKQGIRRGDKVAALLGRDGDAIVALLAVLNVGAVWVPLDGDAPPARWRVMLDDSGAKLVISKTGLRDRLDAPLPVVDLLADGEIIAKRPAKRLKSGPTAGDAAYMIYTSGSTGAPKGVVVSHGALAGHVQAVTTAYALTAADRVLQFAPHVVDTALEQIVPTLCAGACLVLRTGPVWSADSLHRFLVDRQISVADLPPAYLRESLLSWDDTPAPPDLRLLIVGGEALSADTVRLWQASRLTKTRLLNAYGPTEATITCLVHDVERTSPPEGAIPIGRPLPGTIALVLDRDGNPVPEGVIGELYIGGPRLALGYHRRPDLDAERFVTWPEGKRSTRLYRTGDLASVLADGHGGIAFHGRIDHQVKIRGFRVELGEVETCLAAFGLRESAVVPRPDSTGTLTLVAYVVPADSDSFDETALRSFMAARLPAPMLPGAYVVLSHLPVSAAGKLDRAALPAPHSAVTRHTPPHDQIEQQLHEIWAKVLERNPASLGVDDDFQLCGGHSLLWVRLLTEIGRVFKCQVATADFIDAATIRRQADVLRRLDKNHVSGDGDCAVLLRRGNGGRQLFLVHAALGGVDIYDHLARRLPPSFTILGLPAPGLDGQAPPFTDLTALAAHHVTTVRRRQKHGPYALAGWSLGGVVAFEMARQLRRDGQMVEILALIDSVTPDFLRHLENSDDPQVLDHAFTRDAHGIADTGRREVLRRVYRCHAQALAAYRPASCDVPLTLLRAAQPPLEDKTGGWEQWASAGLDVRIVAGNHYSVLAPPDVADCATVLGEILSAAEAVP